MKLKNQNTILKILFIIYIITRCTMFITLIMKFVFYRSLGCRLLIIIFS